MEYHFHHVLIINMHWYTSWFVDAKTKWLLNLNIHITFPFWVKYPLKRNLKLLCFCCDEPIIKARPVFVCTVFHILCLLCPNGGIKESGKMFQEFPLRLGKR